MDAPRSEHPRGDSRDVDPGYTGQFAPTAGAHTAPLPASATIANGTNPAPAGTRKPSPAPRPGVDEEGFLVEHDADEFDTPSPAPGEAPWERSDPQWYKTAVFYEVLVRSFYDPEGAGSGTIKGITAKLDYLQWLGISCLWLPPFYDSPLRDGGYDIRNFREILPEFGTVEDFVDLVDQAHVRGIRVITDVVVNHTSDTHAWFQESRANPDGPYGDFYVWSDDPDKYSDARIIFVDTEESNWTYDSVRGQYFWHRFFSHQPDLNYDNPDVQEAMLDVMRFWLDLGLDGFRLDAVPYLFEREDTNGENLPETHQFLKRVRQMLDSEYPNRVLLAEANQPPDDVVEYFGAQPDGDECHMAFHFPVMPRIFMAIRQGKATPIKEILDSTPDIPRTAQWGIFLRNHDELTLEMVTEEERAYMYGEYARDPRMKSNVGIRRRLAPLVDGDRNQVELLHALLLSLPGSPVLYYGDEIGMGDNIWLADRDGVRTPMQWSSDRNGGFSSAEPERLYLPAVQNDQYGYGTVNVDNQMKKANSQLQWVRSFVHIRQQYDAFGLGEYRAIADPNDAILSFVREYSKADPILCINNLSNRPQPVRLTLPEFAGRTPRELSGGEYFPQIGAEGEFTATLAPHGFFWFELEERA